MRAFADPRHYQLAVLAGLLAYGLLGLDFDIGPVAVASTLASVLAVQLACARLWRVPAFEPRSALISGLSLCLLLRTDTLLVIPVAATATIASKFILRVRGKHVFNPTNLGLVAMLLLTDRAWVSPGQWGNVAFFAALMACVGGLVAYRALRSDVALTFLLVYASLIVGRSLYLGEPLAIPLHRLQSGALLLFTFFMISDPRTTPDSRTARLLFGTLVAVGAWYVQFRLFRTNGLLWSLALCAPLVPVLDRLLPGTRYRWPGSARSAGPPATAAARSDSVPHDSGSPLPVLHFH